MATLERAILAELKQVAKNSKLRLKDIMEWSTGEFPDHEGEVKFFLPDLKVWCSVKVAQQKVQRIVGESAASDGESTPTPQPLT
jgi:hypothetical protein